ncbi:hypothetical protein J2Z83_001036 [Virgibacillus natechei]|uniref:Uncharacterized protein n=1 Tax=Virgibacillus natechei TaxID=1216297 RepID=A0ABS4IDC7_9BACI|nr:hypothetical protein [Virgibacillus natechei]MBP1968942.1 hypothetical protein [Virgibacillus natechei]UZD11732.1 hypothetical protein OLD84_12305 [Virgibacillus natechei]
MQNNGMIIPIIASVGVGAATYYAMTQNNQNFGQAMQKMIPVVTQMNGDGSGMNTGTTTMNMNPPQNGMS